MPKHGQKVPIVVEKADALSVSSDVLALKYAQKFYGADKAAYLHLLAAGKRLDAGSLVPSAYRVVDGVPGISAKKVLFVGTVGRNDFSPRTVRTWARRCLQAAHGLNEPVRSIVMTIHGRGFGLNVREAFAAQLEGLRDAIEIGDFPFELERVTIAEPDESLCELVSETLAQLLPEGTIRYDERKEAAALRMADNAADLVDELEQQAKRAKQTVDSIIDLAPVAGLSTHASAFGKLAGDHARSATRACVGLAVSALLLGASLVAIPILFPLPQQLGSAETILQIAQRLALPAVMLTAILFFTKLFASERHNSIVNKHRETALLTFETLSGASKDDRVKDVVLLQATSAVFSAQATGYLKSAVEVNHLQASLPRILKSLEDDG